MLADKLSSLRKSRGLTQEELALELYVSRSMIAKYETGKAYPTNEILQKIADYFEISVDGLVQKEELIAEHSRTLEDNIVKKRRLITVAVFIGSLILCIVVLAVLSVIDKTEYVIEVDNVQLEWDADRARWNLNCYEESNPDIWLRRAHLYLSEFDVYENSKVHFTIEGEDWFVQFNKHNISEDYRELKTATLYYRVTVRKNLLGMVQGKEGYDLERVDFHLQ